MLEFVHEWLGHYVAVEGALLRTLKALLFQPGLLAADFIAGRRARYVGPLRLYLTASVLSFLLLSWITPQFKIVQVTPESQQALADARASIEQEAHAKDQDTDDAKTVSAFDRFMTPRLERMASMSDQQRQDLVRQRFLRDGPTVVLFMVPVLAFGSFLVYHKRQRVFGEHLVVALNLQTFGLLILTLSVLPYDIGGPLMLVLYVYAVLTYRRVFGGRLVPSALRTAAIALGYWLAMVVVISLGFFLTLLTTS